MRLSSEQAIHDRNSRHRDRVGLAFGPDAPSVEDDQRDNRRARAHRAAPRLNACAPGYTALEPSSSAILMSRLYLAVRSPRLIDPVLICPAPEATARSAIVVSSVSPDRCEMTAV